MEGENPPVNPWYQAETKKWSVQSGLTGGATGIVRIKSGDSPEGVGVQLIAPNGVRTTVYTDADGQIRIPQDAGRLLHLAHSHARPLQALPARFGFHRWRDEARRHRARAVADSDNLPASPALESQLSGAEILWNVPGTAEEKATLQKNCSGCHSWQQIFRNHYDEHGWSLIVDRMMHFTGTAIAVRNTADVGARTPKPRCSSIGFTRVRGPNAQDDAAPCLPASPRRRDPGRGHRIRIAAAIAHAARRRSG